MKRLGLYAFFHCNLAFSSIPASDYPFIIENSYEPLLDLAEDGVPLGIEATAVTLKEIAAIDPGFIKRLKRLWKAGKCEFIGSGYSQLIMPLVPHEINRWNLEIGNSVYRDLLGARPRLLFVNEQAYSRGVCDLAVEAGYSGLIMDWDNCFRYNHYPRHYLYYPQCAKGISSTIPVLWNHSIAFQKFQRCVHAEVTEKEYFEYVESNVSPDTERAFLVYGNDAEVFGYRPGKGPLPEEGVKGELLKLSGILRSLAKDKRYEFMLPGEVLKRFKGHEEAGHVISLESVETPVVVKKQEKYNPTRWAVTGRDSTHFNTECHRVFDTIARLESMGFDAKTQGVYKESLCELWGSDYRTNTIDEKYWGFHNRLGWLKLEAKRALESIDKDIAPSRLRGKKAKAVDKARVERVDEGVVDVSTGTVSASFIERKGWAIKSLRFPKVSDKPLVGTLHHGYYDDIRLGADFFSGHMICVAKDGKKETDLKTVSSSIEEDDRGVRVSVSIPLDIGTLTKRFDISKELPEIRLSYRLKVGALGASSLRLGIFTFLPDAFDKDNLWYECANGGAAPERFRLKGHTVSHDEPVSQSVSASGCLGATDGAVSIGDDSICVRICADKSLLYSVPMLNHAGLDEEGKFFLRLIHSVGETDETAWWTWRGYNDASFTITAEKMKR